MYHVRHRMYHVRLGLWLQRDPEGYVDGMSLYGYVGGDPLSFVDGTGLIRLITGNKDINDAYKAISTTKSGRRLIRRIETLERRTGQEVLINITGTSAKGSGEGALRKGETVFVVDSDGECREIKVEKNGSLVSINPEHSVSEASLATGDGPEDVQLGIRVGEQLFHELCHSDQRLAGRLADVGRVALPAGSEGWTQQQKQEWLGRWENPKEYEAVTVTNEYRRELGRAPRVRYKTTEAQNERAKYLRARAETGGGFLSLRERPVYPFDQIIILKQRAVAHKLRKQGRIKEAEKREHWADNYYGTLAPVRPNVPMVP